MSSAFDIASLNGLTDLWHRTLGDARVAVAVLDGALDLKHPSFTGADLRVLSNSSEGLEHGTHVASVLFGQHGSPIKGLAPACTGIVIPVYRGSSESASLGCSQPALAVAISQAVEFANREKGAALVINISGGQLTADGEAHALLTDVVRSCDPDKVLIVAAAGNDGCDCLHIPGCLPAVLAVGAMGQDGAPLDFSNWGDKYLRHGVLAPGENILGASPSEFISARSGTSYATPIVSGIAALLLSIQLIEGSAPSAAAVRDAILRSAQGCEYQAVPDCRRLLAGRLNIPGALTFITEKGRIPMTQTTAVERATTSDEKAASLLDGQRQAHITPSERHPAQPDPVGSACGIDGTSADVILPSDCGCGGAKKAGTSFQKVFAIGKLSFDYGTRQRRDYFAKRIGNPDDPVALYNHLITRPMPIDGAIPQYTILNGPQFANRQDITAFTWILHIDETPVYAINPMGPFAFETHDTLVAFLRDQFPTEREMRRRLGIPPRAEGRSDQDDDDARPVPIGTFGEGVERMALAGIIIGETRLYTGEQVPVVAPDLRGLVNWRMDALLDAIRQVHRGMRNDDGGDDADAQSDAVMSAILHRMIELTRNLGISSADRARNYAATDAAMVSGLLSDPVNLGRLAGMELDDIRVERSPLCRPDYDCWDVIIIFFDPNNLQRARIGLRYTIDVSDVVPNILTFTDHFFTLR